MPSLEWFGPTVAKLCSGQWNPDAAADDDDAADAATADKSNPYISTFQATQKCAASILIWPLILLTQTANYCNDSYTLSE